MILSESFYEYPSQVIVNDILSKSCKKNCTMHCDLNNNVTLIFDREIISCANMFSGLKNIKEIDLSNFDTSKVIDMNSMFKECTNLEKINFGNINASSVKNMNNLFLSCENLMSINLSNFDTSSVTNMSGMFARCYKIKIIDASSFNTTKVENMEDMFGYCRELESLNVSSFNTSNVKTMKGMFIDCQKLLYIDLQNFNGNSLVNILYMFAWIGNLKYINLYNFATIRNLNSDSIFKDTSTDLKFCIQDKFTKNYLFVNKDSFCPEMCHENNKKFDEEKIVCVDSCGENTYEYKNICYINHEINNLPNILYRNVCLAEIPYNYYLDLDDMIYKECNEICRTCSIHANNCKSCNEKNVLINNNCYTKCDFYYYFNDSNFYSCTNNFSCPEKYNKLIINTNECIDNCMRDNYYKYNFNDSCIEICPDGTIYNDSNKICYYIEKNINIDSTYIIDDTNINITTNNIFNNISNNMIYSEEDSLIIYLQQNIMNGKMDDIIKV